jgi:hypothetical protein
MTDAEHPKLEEEELEAQDGSPLPDREAMSIISPLAPFDEPVEFDTPGGPPDESW